MQFKQFSEKQLIILTWWINNNQYSGIIADGSIRSGKTLSMSLGFIIWAMENYNEQMFGFSGKTLGSVQRNILYWIIPVLKNRGYKTILKDNVLQIICNKNGEHITNYFHMFGGKDERSYQVIQGMTAAGWFFDEAALQPESFVNQAISRCSVKGSKYWFNCNPDKPSHWFLKEYIEKKEEKKLLHLHFTLDDNLALDEEIKDRLKHMFTGIFYKRYILGEWALAKGIIFDTFNPDINLYDKLDDEIKLKSTRYLSIDYGVTNPFVILEIYDHWDTLYQDKEIYYDSRKQGKQLTDEEMADMIEQLTKSEPYPVEKIIIDPSATSLKVLLRNRGYLIKDADNEVLEGIKITNSALYQKKYMINKHCKHTIEEIGGYVWDEKAKDRGIEKPVKINDHACDAIRYAVNTLMKKRILGRV